MKDAAAVIVGDPVLARWGGNIAQFRKLLNLSQPELAERVGVSYQTVWRWEKGQMEPRRHHKKALASELNTVEAVLFS